ncbi:MAG TPA: DISARM system phospholipase D-like protein DrmC [Jatrophihabitans sp.]|jgi:phosphatidylserine/phosphatidylglycerophosphate/cardiolipin synthase-like enzyme|uniref:DISARM system phospholipase D-like protein DrmC n=1 Tax=Jatrophihabitans sp. TaxID=1932789 RepID=UPI002EDD1D77
MAVPVPLLKACAALGRELTPSHARDLAEALAPYASRAGAEPAASVVPTAHFGAVVRRLLKAWDAYPAVAGSELGPAIAAAAYAHELARTEPELELVLSGPTSAHVHARRTDDVLLELIASAQTSLLLVTYSLHMYPELKAALKGAIARDVQVTVLAEDPKDNGKFNKDPAFALAGLAVTRLRWPSDQRPTGWTSLHAKIAVADDHTVFLTSANLSLKASGDNVEAGVLIRGGDWARRILNHIGSQRASAVLIDA